MSGPAKRWSVVLAVLGIVSLTTAGFVVAGHPLADRTHHTADTDRTHHTDRTAAGPGSTGSQARVAPADTPSAGATEPANQVPARPSDAVGALLDARAQALLRGDRAAWLAPLLASQEQFVRQQSELFDRLRTVRPESWRYQVAGGSALATERRAALGGTAWLADVQLGYRLTGGDRTADTTREEYLTVVRTAAGWRFAADTDGPTARDVWDLGPVTRAASGRCVVIGSTTRSRQIEQLAGECDANAARVDRAWGTAWARRTVLVVPRTTKDLATLLGASQAGLDDTAAITTGPADGAADGVLVNGDAFEQLSALGRRVVITHELVHVAVRSTGARYAPTWLSEGFADHVAYEGTGLTAAQIADGAIKQTRRNGPPGNLPGDKTFDASTDGAEAAYDESWVAVGLIGEHTALKSFYEQAADHEHDTARYLDEALRRAGLGGVRAFTRLWQADLRHLAE